MVTSYWSIGLLIVEDEQNGSERAEYGKAVLEGLSKKLTAEFGKLTHGDVSQMDSYIRMFDAQYKRDDDNPTIGLILCSEKNDAVVKYSVLADAKQIFASKYELHFQNLKNLHIRLKWTDF